METFFHSMGIAEADGGRSPYGINFLFTEEPTAPKPPAPEEVKPDPAPEEPAKEKAPEDGMRLSYLFTSNFRNHTDYRGACIY